VSILRHIARQSGRVRNTRKPEPGLRVAAAAAAAAAATAAALPLLAPQQAGASVWEQIQHNIQGGSGTAPNNPNKAGLFIQMVNLDKPVSASMNEVCASQANAVNVYLGSQYAVWFMVAASGPSGCGGEPFGNVLIVAKDVSPTRAGGGVDPYGNPGEHDSGGNRQIFALNLNGSEHKRNDCAYIGGSSASSKWAACTLHTTAKNTTSGTPGARTQINEVRDLSTMTAPRLYMGDFNERDYIISNYTGWRWDTLSTGSGTHIPSGKKIDWVLGEGNSNFTRLNPSVVGTQGTWGYESDHYSLISYLRAT